MIFVTLGKFRKKPTKEMIAQSSELMKAVKADAKILGWYWTLGRYDIVLITEGKDEKQCMKNCVKFGDILSTETLVAMTREEAVKLIE